MARYVCSDLISRREEKAALCISVSQYLLSLADESSGMRRDKQRGGADELFLYLYNLYKYKKKREEQKESGRRWRSVDGGLEECVIMAVSRSERWSGMMGPTATTESSATSSG